ncbi:hypothetical protein [Paenibacillus sp. L3-i20]|uniref:hypothetical protein n=1 Tax=Paenibacillus sp. L3-i20 TaxID=2905833 RepID=UPI001EDD5DDC|nr:hypothetical protein [Paenibacillus sp. L3-i20]
MITTKRLIKRGLYRFNQDRSAVADRFSATKGASTRLSQTTGTTDSPSGITIDTLFPIAKLVYQEV